MMRLTLHDDEGRLLMSVSDKLIGFDDIESMSAGIASLFHLARRQLVMMYGNPDAKEPEGVIRE